MYTTGSSPFNILPIPWINKTATEFATFYQLQDQGIIVGIIEGINLNTSYDSFLIVEYTKTTD
jgi:hypothetical protein